jgi:hypothetical protein
MLNSNCISFAYDNEIPEAINLQKERFIKHIVLEVPVQDWTAPLLWASDENTRWQWWGGLLTSQDSNRDPTILFKDRLLMT